MTIVNRKASQNAKCTQNAQNKFESNLEASEQQQTGCFLSGRH